jgi:hypothetical protein
MSVTSSHGLMVTLDLIGETSLGSSLVDDKPWYIWMLSSSSFDTVKIFIFFVFFIAHFVLVKNVYKTPYSLKALKRGPIITGYLGHVFLKILYHVSLLLRESLAGSLPY